jgi:hypothetical protein
MRRALTAAIVLSLLFVPGAAWAQRCEHERAIDLSVDAGDATSASISVGAGSLLIEGGSGDTVRITGRACADSADRLEGIAIRTGRDGRRVEVETEIEDSRSWMGGGYAYADLEITVPSGLAVVAQDGSGDAVVRNVGSLEFEDGSGGLVISDVAGDARIQDGSGELEVSGVAGDVRIHDGSGGMTVRGAGSVVVESDGSGSIRIEDVRGAATVESDGSGNITVTDVAGDFTVGRKGSGSIRHENVGGTVDVPRRR